MLRNNKTEKSVVRLVESRAVASVAYTDAISHIIEYINNFYKSNQSEINIDNPNNKNVTITYNFLENDGKYYKKKCNAFAHVLKLELPDYLTEQIDIFEYLIIDVNIRTVWPINTPVKHYPYIKKSLSQGSGNTSFPKENKVSNGKLLYGAIQINVNSLNGELLERSVSSALHHELNHAFEDYHRQMTTNGEYGMHQRGTRRSIFKPTDEYDKRFKNICYRLFNNSELSATATQTYAELKSMKSRRENFRVDLENTAVFGVYKQLFEDINELLNLKSTGHWEKYRNYFQYGTEKDVQKFKQQFCNKALKLLDKLFKRMGSAASLYYDESEGEHHVVRIE